MTFQLTPQQSSLHEKALKLSCQHRLAEHELVEILCQVEATKLFKALGFTSTFVYAVRALRLSEANAYAFIAVARKSQEVPQLLVALRAEKLSVARASRIVSVLTGDNAAALIDFASRHSSSETDREVARIAGKDKPAKLRSLKVSAEVIDLLARAQSLLASSKKEQVSANAALKLVLTDYLERHDPVKRAERVEKRKHKGAKAASVNSARTEPGNSRKPLTAQQKHAVFRRDQGRCTFVDASGERCGSDRWLHLHHVTPVSLGGTNDPDNLTLLCATHHDLVYQLSLGIDGQVNWLRERAQVYCH